jgi:hypothetical protein
VAAVVKEVGGCWTEALLLEELLKTVLARERNFPSPFFSWSLGTEGPDCA